MREVDLYHPVKRYLEALGYSVKGEICGCDLVALKNDHREVVVCRYLLDLSEAETAAALGVRRGTVKSRLSRALVQLRGELEA